MLRRFTWLLVLALLLTMTVPAVAEPKPIAVFVNGQALKFDVPPAVIGGRTLVPLRAIFEALGANLTWDQESRTATATWPGGELVLPVGKDTAHVKGVAKKLDVPAQLVESRTLVPLRFVAEAIGAQVGWYGGARLITINRPMALEEVTVTAVTDGDTVELRFADGRAEKVRLIGIDTPETVHPTKGVEPFGPEASAYTKGKLTGQTVLVELDVDQRDQYGRLLVYLYLTSGTMYNAVLADEGYARMATFPPNVRYVEVFRALQADAQAAARGLWGLPESAPPPATAPKYDPKGPDRDCTDFATHAEAQAFFEAAGGPGADPHRLDSDRDGIACETLP